MQSQKRATSSSRERCRVAIETATRTIFKGRGGCLRADRDRVPARRVGWREEALQHRNGTHHLPGSPFPGRAHHGPGLQHGQLHHRSTARVRKQQQRHQTK